MSHAQHVETILLVDNDQIVRNLIGRMLAHPFGGRSSVGHLTVECGLLDR